MGLFNLFKPKASPPQEVQQPLAKVLIVDDDQMLRTFYHDLLTKNNYAVFTAVNGQEGLNAASATQPNVIILDIVMPGMDGITVLKQLRENTAAQSIPVIMLTSSASVKNMEETAMYAVSGFLNKSTVTPDEILTAVREALIPKSKNPVLAQVESSS